MSRKTTINLTILTVLILAASAILTACQPNAEFGDGQNSEAIGRFIIDSANAADETLNENPGIDAVVGDGAKPAIGVYRLAGEAVLALGLFLQTRRRKELENAIMEIDDNPSTPEASKQAVSIQSRKVIRKIVH